MFGCLGIETRNNGHRVQGSEFAQRALAGFGASGQNFCFSKRSKGFPFPRRVRPLIWVVVKIMVPFGGPQYNTAPNTTHIERYLA